MPEEYIFYDANGIQWVYLPEETRVVVNDDDPANRKDPQGGYPAWSLVHAIKTLTDFVYMEKQC